MLPKKWCLIDGIANFSSASSSEVELLTKNLAKLNSDMECPGIQGGLDRHSMAMSHEVVGIFVSSTSN